MNNITINKFAFLTTIALATPFLNAQEDADAYKKELKMNGTTVNGYEEEKSYTNKLVIPFSGDGERFLDAHLMNGGITVTGYEGTEVIVEATNAEFNQVEKESEDGMRLIGTPTTGLFAEEKDNTIKVGSKNMNKEVDLRIQVPFNTSIKLNCMNNGDITVDNVSGEMNIENLNGDITVTDASGVILAHALNGDITVFLAQVQPDKPMSFTSLNGDIDVSMPADTKANLKMQTFQGDIRSNFEIVMLPAKEDPTVSEDRGDRGRGRYRMEFESGVQGTINGGGPQFVFNTHNGDIRIRKTKAETEE